MSLTNKQYAEMDRLIDIPDSGTWDDIAKAVGCQASTVSRRANKRGKGRPKAGRPKRVYRREPHHGYLGALESAKRKLGFTRRKTLTEDEKLMVGAIMQRDARTRKPKPLENMSSYAQGEDRGAVINRMSSRRGAAS